MILGILVVYHRCIYCIYCKTFISSIPCFDIYVSWILTISFGPKSRIFYLLWSVIGLSVFRCMLMKVTWSISNNFTRKFTFNNMNLHVPRWTWLRVHTTHSQVSELWYGTSKWSINIHSKQNQTLLLKHPASSPKTLTLSNNAPILMKCLPFI